MKYLKRLWFTLVSIIYYPYYFICEVLRPIWKGEIDNLSWNIFKNE